jgi:anti-anti-sigma factor
MQNNYSASIDVNADGVLVLRGNLNAATAVALQLQGQSLIAKQPTTQCVIDLKEVGHSSSVGVALLTVWLRFAQSVGKTIRYQHMPQSMLDMVRLSGLDELLGRI